MGDNTELDGGGGDVFQFPFCCDKDQDQKQLEEERVCFTSHATGQHLGNSGQEITAGIWMYQQKQRAWRDGALLILKGNHMINVFVSI